MSKWMGVWLEASSDVEWFVEKLETLVPINNLSILIQIRALECRAMWRTESTERVQQCLMIRKIVVSSWSVVGNFMRKQTCCDNVARFFLLPLAMFVVLMKICATACYWPSNQENWSSFVGNGLAWCDRLLLRWRDGRRQL